MSHASVASVNGVNDKLFIIGVRGYNALADKNKRSVYDDALFLVIDDQVSAYTANTDPSVDRKGIAVLQPGVYLYKKGLHGIHHLNFNDAGDKHIYDELNRTGKDVAPIPGRLLPYWALRQAGPVTVLRDGSKTPETKQHPAEWPYIDIHKGGLHSTSSEGCQTIYGDQWEEFRDKVFQAMLDFKQPLVKYILTLKS